MYYKQIENGIITAIGGTSVIAENQIEISGTEYNALLSVIQSKPEDTLEYIYRLSAEKNQYVHFSRTRDETIEWYVQEVTSEEMALDEVPEDYRAEVEASLPKHEEPKYTLDEAAALIASEVNE